MKKFVSLLVLLFVPPAGGEIFADMKIRHRPVSAGEDQITTLRIRLEHTKVPRIVAHFIGLASGRRAWIDPLTGSIREGVPYYDGIIFHRLDHDFVIQGGDPLGTGRNGPGYVVQDQFDQSLRHSGRYFLSCAKTNLPNTFGSQFFITLKAATFLDDKHPVFGEVVNVSAEDTSSRDLIDAFTSPAEYPVGAGERPVTPITIESVSFAGADYDSFPIDDPSYRLPYVAGQNSKISYSKENGGELKVQIERKALYNYHAYLSEDLVNWSRSRSVLSVDDETGYKFFIPLVSQKHFYRQVAVDYSQIYNPSPAILIDGSAFRFQSDDGKFITLTSDGAGTGTWEDQDGATGNLTGLQLTEVVPDTGVFVNPSDQAGLFPLLNLSATFESAAGAAGYMRMSGVLSFHTENVGGFEGSVFLPASTPFNRPFSFIPAP